MLILGLKGLTSLHSRYKWGRIGEGRNVKEKVAESEETRPPTPPL